MTQVTRGRVGDLAVHGGAPVREKAFPAWPQFGEEEHANLLQVLDSGEWSEPGGGAFVQTFERAFADLHGVAHGVAVMNGSVSLTLILRAMGIGSGDEVIVPAYTFLATATAVLEVNALPIFVDIDPGTWCISPDAVEAAITPRTRAIIPVHLGGHPADMDRLCEIARRHGVRLIEDAAHAHGAVWNGRPVGSWGEVGSFSMQASKNLTGGEGGIVVTNDPEMAELITSFRNCGRQKDGIWYEHVRLGGNYRMTEFQAAILTAQMTRFDEQRMRRDANGRILNAGLAEIDGIRPQRRDPRTSIHGNHLYWFRYDRAAFDGLSRELFLDALKAEGVPCSPGYPVPLNRQPLFVNRAFDTRATSYDPDYAPTRFGALDLPVTEAICNEVVMLPQSLLLGDAADMDDVIAAVRKIQRAVNRQGAASFAA
ncbi:MAG: DegT/DnrJ/EryC1/StrS family aminotransferase [Thermomicrobiales bacterium]